MDQKLARPVLIDGGRGQLSAVTGVMDELGLDDICVVAISKGPDRNAGREQFHIRGKESFTLPQSDQVMHYLQRLRDEAHRYAIGSHRARRTSRAFKTRLMVCRASEQNVKKPCWLILVPPVQLLVLECGICRLLTVCQTRWLRPYITGFMKKTYEQGWTPRCSNDK